MAKDREVRLRAQKKYDESHKDLFKQYHFKLNRVDDADIIEKLEKVENRQGYIKDLIRKDIQGGK